MLFDPEDYPHVVTLRFRTENEAEQALHDLEGDVWSVDYNDDEIGRNNYYVDDKIKRRAHVR